ncbi:LuxR C-terminal-related transcriptional regulator [Micromonospora sp. WMMD1082]|uniref:helix-turn-helix domain-containing protein n=1 Tax=Micromonospora sp. WMMD1082 TaxID=3016104 RepID=UPI002415B3C1|nr:LuxR C-terminal-related transcriptional regulator [Micromonospora sp. WMMD1082]MDG4798463.1 LuxR C-terminal-related transcriptional regulator [Micromonospora sp. WMMD1082]
MEGTLLQRLGVSATAEAVYWAMVDHPEWDAGQLATRLGVPETVVRDALSTLADRALILPSSSRPGTMRAVSPQVGLLALLDQAEQQAIAHQAKIQAARASVLARVTNGPDRERDEIVRLEGHDAVRNRLAEHAHTASESCLTLTTGKAMTAAAIETGNQLSRIALSRGVAIRHIYQESILDDAASLAYAERMAKHGEQSRITPEAPLRMTLIDRRFALIPIEPRSGRGALEIRSGRLVSALRLLFDMTWEKSTPLARRSAGDSHGLTHQESAILRLLRRGRTDEAIGRQLGLSERTVRRVVADLMKRLDAESRFQAGAEATQRGWI